MLQIRGAPDPAQRTSATFSCGVRPALARVLSIHNSHRTPAGQWILWMSSAHAGFRFFSGTCSSRLGCVRSWLPHAYILYGQSAHVCSTALTYSEERRRKRRRSTYSTLLCIGAPERNKFCRAYGAAMKMVLVLVLGPRRVIYRRKILPAPNFVSAGGFSAKFAPKTPSMKDW